MLAEMLEAEGKRVQQRAWSKRWRENNPEKVAARRVQSRAYMAALRASDPEKNRAIQAKSREKNRDISRARKRQDYKENPEKYRLAARARYAANRQEQRAKNRRWIAANPDKVKAAARKHNLKKHYGLTVEQRDAILVSQGAACAICGDKEPKGRGWQIDHCHQSGIVRGILCQNCNLMVGHARDRIDVLQSAINYLRGVR